MAKLHSTDNGAPQSIATVTSVRQSVAQDQPVSVSVTAAGASTESKRSDGSSIGERQQGDVKVNVDDVGAGVVAPLVESELAG